MHSDLSIPFYVHGTSFVPSVLVGYFIFITCHFQVFFELNNSLAIINFSYDSIFHNLFVFLDSIVFRLVLGCWLFCSMMNPTKNSQRVFASSKRRNTTVVFNRNDFWFHSVYNHFHFVTCTSHFVFWCYCTDLTISVLFACTYPVADSS